MSPLPPQKTVRTAIITGASSGIGLDLARCFLNLGANVVINGRNPDKLERARLELGSPTRVAALAGHVGDEQTGRRLVVLAHARFGAADLLINNAGIFAPKPFVESTEEDLDRFYTTNVKGTFLVSPAVVPSMIRAGGGSIINIGTVLVDQPMTSTPVSAVMASKGGVHALTRALAAELAEHRIRVNAIAPGIFESVGAGKNLWPDENTKLRLQNAVPARRFATCAEIAQHCLWMIAPGSSYVTGECFTADGGASLGQAMWEPGERLARKG